jgi:cytosine/adenosine deaminase-related metal-dependent hydrolase
MTDLLPILLQGGTLLVHDDNDNVSVFHKTDLFIKDGKIASISENIQIPPETEIIDCTSKIISPGFVDTHHHVWQTQLKGRHSDDTLLDYHPKGNLQYYNYSPEDVFWGELGGLLESINGGTTTIVDHAHMSKTADHVRAGLNATVMSGIRSVFCYSLVMNIASWDREGMVNAEPPVPEWWMPLLEELSKDRRLCENDRIDLGLGFDSYHLPETQVRVVFEKARTANVKLITSHWRRNNIAGKPSILTFTP